jgi:hypothetical protein
MWKNLSLEQFQKDIDEGWVEYFDNKIAHWRRIQIRCTTADAKAVCERQIEHFKVMRRRR